MKKITGLLSIVSVHLWSYATGPSAIYLTPQELYQCRVDYENSLNTMNVDELKEESKGVRQLVIDVYIDLCTLPSTDLKGEDLKKYYRLKCELDVLMQQLNNVIKRKGDTSEEDYILKLSDLYSDAPMYSTPNDLIKKIAEREMWQKKYQSRTSKLNRDLKESQSLFQSVFNLSEQFYKKGWLHCFPTDGEMNTVKLCAQWYEIKGYTINSESGESLIEWKDFCRKCSEFLEQNK